MYLIMIYGFHTAMLHRREIITRPLTSPRADVGWILQWSNAISPGAPAEQYTTQFVWWCGLWKIHLLVDWYSASEKVCSCKTSQLDVQASPGSWTKPELHTMQRDHIHYSENSIRAVPNSPGAISSNTITFFSINFKSVSGRAVADDASCCCRVKWRINMIRPTVDYLQK